MVLPDYVHIGFTGTQEGMTDQQALVFYDIINRMASTVHNIYFHNGDCIGADATAMDVVDLVRSLHPVTSFHTIGHIPNIDTKRAFKKFDELRDPLPYMDRNLAIVKESELLIATPKEEDEQLRSGTWSTIRKARTHLIPIIRINPTGETYIWPM